MIYARPDRPDWIFIPSRTTDGRKLVISAVSGADPKNALFVLDAKIPTNPVRALIPTDSAIATYIDDRAGTFLVSTTAAAPRGRLVAVNVSRPDIMRTVVPESGAVLQSVTPVGGRLVVNALRDAHSELQIFERSGRRGGEIPLPTLGVVDAVDATAARDVVAFTYEGLTIPPTHVSYNMRSGRRDLERLSPARFDPNRYRTDEVFARSADGTRVPVFIARRRDRIRSGPLPTLLYGYGVSGLR